MSIQVQLNGSVSSIVPVTNTWTVVSGDDTKIAFSPNANTIDALVTVSAAGTYVLRLTSVTEDGQSSSHDEMTITAAVNQTPTVEAGDDLFAIEGVATQLNGSATDDAYPDANSSPLFSPHALTYSWAAVSHDADITYSPSRNVANPTITFNSSGHTNSPYTMQLSVSDSKATGADTLVVNVLALPGTHNVAATAANPSATLSNTDVEYRVDLSRCGNSWWANMTGSAGEDIRVTDASNNPLPFDHIGVSKSAKKGLLIYKRPVGATGASVRIWNGGTAARLAANDTYGQYNAYRSDCLAFFPDGGGSGTSNRTQNTSNYVSVVGFPPVTTGNLGPIGAESTTFAFGKYCYRTRGSNAFAAPLTISAAANIVLGDFDDIWIGGVVATNNGSTDGTKNSFYLRGSKVASNQTCTIGEQGDYSSPVYEVATTTTSVGGTGWYHYSGTLASTGNSRSAISQATNNTDTSALAAYHSNQYDHLVIGGRPRLSLSSASHFCEVDTPLSLVSIYSSELTAAHLKYQGTMLDQSTMFPTWSFA